MIRVSDLSIGYGQTVLQKNLNFEVEAQSVFAILGGSGSGKSTLLRHLIGLETPFQGRIEIDVPERDDGQPRFGVMFQSGALLGSLTVGENVALPLNKWTRLPEDATDAIVDAKLSLVGLDGAKELLPAEISGGMKKRAGIARALAMDPPLLFLDEPSAGLDPISAVELDDLILSLNENLGTTIVLVTHELPSIFKVARDCIVLDKETQGIIARGKPAELKESSEDQFVRDFFNRQSSGGT